MIERGRSYLIVFLLSIIVFLVEYLIIDEDVMLTKYFEFQLLLIYGIVLVLNILRCGLYNLFTFVLVGFFMFSIGGVLHFFISDDNIQELEGIGFGDFYFSNVIIQKSLLIYSLFILLTYLAYNYLYNDDDLEDWDELSMDNTVCFRIGSFLMWAFLAIELYKGYLYFSAFSLDRVLIYLYGNMSNPVPTWVRFFATFFEMGYAFIICSHPEKKVFRNYSILFFVVLIPEILLGNRAMFGAFILFYLWYYARYYNPQPIKTRYALIAAVSILFLFQAMQFYRDGSDLGAVSYSLTSFFKGQAVSFYILPLYFQYSDSIQFYLYPFVLYGIFSGFTGYTGQSLETLQHNCGVGHQLMYTINPDYYLSGASLGSSIVVELYDLGIVGIIIGALLFYYMLHFF